MQMDHISRGASPKHRTPDGSTPEFPGCFLVFTKDFSMLTLYIPAMKHDTSSPHYYVGYVRCFIFEFLTGPISRLDTRIEVKS
jgi:hypothetical protein